ncbi:MAG: 3-methyl-2-oxobutanoate hydroxymethyltransferase [Gammaproteobacteria bacterium]|nr:3-methyl-2-oxobutanoate hydroxymethyltransferase [Gammaproteobacteria bacterium]
MNKITLSSLRGFKRDAVKFSVVAAYDASFSRLLADAEVPVILVGDSLGMTVQGHASTVPVSVADVAYHTACVARGNQYSLIIGDLPFMSYTSVEQALDTSKQLMQAGAHMVKLEGGRWLSETFQALNAAGVPSCAHLGLTPQSVNKLGGYKVQGRDADEAQTILEDAIALEAAGADMLVLECVPSELAAKITHAVNIPVIGIGAGADTDAQVLVLHDMLGITPRAPKFSKNFLEGSHSILEAFERFVADVKDGHFPAEEHQFN